MPDKVTEAAKRLWFELGGTLILGAIIMAVVLTFATRAFGPMGWGARLTQWIGG